MSSYGCSRDEFSQMAHVSRGLWRYESVRVRIADAARDAVLATNVVMS